MGPPDYEPRVQFCQWMIQRCTAVPNIAQFVLFMDEACFTRDGVVYCRSSHFWSDVNPCATLVASHQQRFSMNSSMWTGIFQDQLLGPYLLQPRLNGQRYLRFIRDVLETVPLVRERRWLQLEWAPSHFAVEVRRNLGHAFPNCWIGRVGPVPRPPRSPDLIPLDFSGDT